MTDAETKTNTLAACPPLTDELAAIRELIEKWEREGAFLNNPKDWPADREAGRTYQTCAKELKALLAANDLGNRRAAFGGRC